MSITNTAEIRKSPEGVFTSHCPQCNQAMTPASTEAQARRNLGLHLWKQHGVHSDRTAATKRYLAKRKQQKPAARSADNGLDDRAQDDTPLALLKKRADQADYYKRNRARILREARERRALRNQQKQPSQPQPVVDQVVPIALTTCAVCGARFYARKGS